MRRSILVDPKIIIFSGSGLSAESGVPTFRGKEGLWNGYRIEEVCSEHSWLKNYEQVHLFYNHMREALQKVEPNVAHQSIAKIQRQYGDNVLVVTQNVDDLLERSGVEGVLHLHGQLTKMECDVCGHAWTQGYKPFDYALKNQTCKNCGSHDQIKPHIVFFGGRAPDYEILYEWLEYAHHPDSIVIVCGTQGNVVPIDSLLQDALATKILNNFESSDYINHNNFDHVFFEPATTAWPKIESYIEQNWLIV
ncbi:MAG: NAD-dependent deacetylase [Methyloprofundus sp.]|nr:NAD-dependent deacetylase [Methyloprofundus sp.]